MDDAAADRSIARLIHLRRQILSAREGPMHFDPHYELLAPCAEDSLGVTYEARQTAVDRKVVLKLIREDIVDDPAWVDDFLADAMACGALEHPNILPLHDIAISHENRLFYVTKKMNGVAWGQVIRAQSQEENLRVLMRVADALSFAHSRDIIHRNIKPDNVTVGDFGEVYLHNWNLAVAVGSLGKANALNHANALAGTPFYMAPEMAKGDVELIGKTSDIYLLGAVLFEIVTGHPPRRGEVQDCLNRATRNEIELTERDDELTDIVFTAMASRPQDRFQTAREFQDAIRAYGKHNESVAMTDRAHQLFNMARQDEDYRHFSDALYGYQEALHLWEDNQDAREGIRATEIVYAQHALDHGDLDLAASMLSDDADPRQIEMRQHIDHTRQLRRSRKKKMVLTIQATFALLVFLTLFIGRAVLSIRKAGKNAHKALSALERAKQERGRQRAETAPLLFASAGKAAVRGSFTNALAVLETVTEYAPDHDAARMLKVQLHMILGQFGSAEIDLKRYLEHNPDDTNANRLLTLCRDAEVISRPYVRQHLAGLFEERRSFSLAGFLYRKNQRMVNAAHAKLARAWPDLAFDLRLHDRGGFWIFRCHQCADMGDLAPLAGLPLSHCILRDATAIDSLAAFSGMQLQSLDLLYDCPKLHDLQPLAGVPLRSLKLGANQIASLEPLRDMPLYHLTLHQCRALPSLDQLKGMPLHEFHLNGCPQIKTIEPLRGMPLRELSLNWTGIADLQPLENMPLEKLALRGSSVTDIGVLRTMLLRELRLAGCERIRDFSSLAELPLQVLDLSGTRVGDLRFLRGKPIQELNLAHCTKATGLMTLNTLPLKSLAIEGCVAAGDLSFLKGIALEKLTFSPAAVTQGLDIIRYMPSLCLLGTNHSETAMDRDTFWKKYDAGAFR